MARKLKSDKVLFIAMLVLVCASVVMVYSASAVMAMERYHQPYLFLLKQVMWAVMGLTAVAVVMRLDYRLYREPAVVWTALIVVTILLVAVLFGPKINGTRRWFGFGGIGVQPSELAKLATIMFTAVLLERRMHRINDVAYSLVPIGVVTALFVGLILLQPDFGTAFAIVLIVGMMVFAAGLDLRYIAVVLVAGVPAGAWVLMSANYRRERLLAFLNPESDPLGTGFQILQSLISVGTGGRVRPRAHGRRAEAVLPARAAHRLHLRGHRRGARARGHDDGAARLRGDPVARAPDREAGSRRVRRVPRRRAHGDDRRTGLHQHERGARAAAHQGHPAAVRERRGLVAAHQPGRHGHPAEPLAARGADARSR
jgi:hypothetical protein